MKIQNYLSKGVTAISVIYELLTEYIWWFKFDLRQSSLFPTLKSKLATLLVTSHVLEKGISMPDRRYGFGYERVREIIKMNNSVIKNFSENHIEIQSSLNNLEQYLQIHESAGFKLPDDIASGIKNLLRYKKTETKACFESTPEKLFIETTSFYEFAHSRHTVRWFSDKKIDKCILIKAIELAQTAPSACNRQSVKVYVIDSDDKKAEVSKLQNGNRGFGHLADKILLITSDMKCWKYEHRYMAYIDGGIFVQNLLYALHYYKICACTLNAGLTVRERNKLQELIGYSPSEIPVVFICIGKAPEHFMVAGSQRKSVDKVCQFV